jgi:hypothetical protein
MRVKYWSKKSLSLSYYLQRACHFKSPAVIGDLKLSARNGPCRDFKDKSGSTYIVNYLQTSLNPKIIGFFVKSLIEVKQFISLIISMFGMFKHDVDINMVSKLQQLKNRV